MLTLLSQRRGSKVFVSIFRCSFSTSPSFSLKRLIKPFFLKFHPDRQLQQGLPDMAQKVNLAAIQNLNSYIDGVNKLMRQKNGQDGPNKYPFPNEKHTVEIEFVMAKKRNQEGMQPSQLGNKNTSSVSTSRRKLELRVPPMTMAPTSVKNHVTRQFLRLLRISDLPIPTSLSLYAEENGNDNEEYNDYNIGKKSWAHDIDNNTHDYPKQRQKRKMTAWEASRERFWERHNRNFDFKKFNQVYREALHDAENHLHTRNWIRDNPRLRRKLLANVLSNVKFKEIISPLERLVAYRRLLQFLDENFDDLLLEDMGKYYEEKFSILVSEPRSFNLSSSALRKRRKKKQILETGFCFTIHHNNRVTLSIPADFENNELKDELLQNMSDFMQTQGSGLDGDYYAAMFGQDTIV
mmetsp:Transcript_33192/g.37704  ORF Transcript_33192/g.37704 Transcript_33192/m.37704 type:complete len:407 (-) Transcript_33192:138-1358(-)